MARSRAAFWPFILRTRRLYAWRTRRAVGVSLRLGRCALSAERSVARTGTWAMTSPWCRTSARAASASEVRSIASPLRQPRSPTFALLLHSTPLLPLQASPSSSLAQRVHSLFFCSAWRQARAARRGAKRERPG
eukprot:5473424-Pleurochrysis_carterae.AAC.1